MKFTKRSTPPTIVCAVALAIGAATGCSRSGPVADATLPTVPDSTVPATTAPTTAPTTTTPATPAPTAAPTTSGPAATPPPSTTTSTTIADNGNTTMSQMTIESIAAVLQPDLESQTLEAMAWGDVDGDGDDDAIVRITSCGASCGTELFLVIDESSTPTVVVNGAGAQFGPWYNGAGAGQSSLTSAAIGVGTVTLVGGLCGNLPDCDRETQRTATYQYADGALEPVSIDPEPG